MQRSRSETPSIERRSDSLDVTTHHPHESQCYSKTSSPRASKRLSRFGSTPTREEDDFDSKLALIRGQLRMLEREDEVSHFRLTDLFRLHAPKSSSPIYQL